MSKPTEQTTEARHAKHQDLMQKHRMAKAEKRKDHNHPSRKRNVPPNGLK